MISQSYKLLSKVTNNNTFGYLAKNHFTTKTKTRKVTLFPGDGIGPEISQAVLDIFNVCKVPVEWEFHKIHTQSQTAEGDLISAEAIKSILDNKIALKGPFETPIGKGHRSLNVTLRKKLNLYANVRPCKSLKGINSFYEDVDVVTIRENTEGEYSGIEHVVIPGVVENFKIITENACRNIAEYAFQYAVKYERQKVTACHKAGIQKLGDGLFLRICQETSTKYPQIKFEEEQVDTVCMKLARDPKLLDVMVMPNLYGDIVSDLCAGLIGGLGLTPSGNIGREIAVYEAVHGSAPDIAGKGLANPTALLLSSCMMLEKMELETYANKIRSSILKTYEDGKYLTRDLGGKSGTSDFVKAVIDNIVQANHQK